MKKFVIPFLTSLLLSQTIFAIETNLPGDLGKIDITNNVITVPEGKAIPDGEYKVTIEGKEATVVFSGNKGVLK